MDNKRAEHFNIALTVILVSIVVSLFAFRSEDNKVTGFAVSDSNSASQAQPNLLQFRSVSSLSTLSSGTYYIDGDGIVYWFDDNSMPPVGKITYLQDSQKNRKVYVDKDGNVGYLIN